MAGRRQSGGVTATPPMLSPVWPLPALLIAVPLVVHVEETGPLRPPQEAALASLSSVIEETLGPVRMDYAFTLAVVERVGTRIADLLSA